MSEQTKDTILNELAALLSLPLGGLLKLVPQYGLVPVVSSLREMVDFRNQFLLNHGQMGKDIFALLQK